MKKDPPSAETWRLHLLGGLRAERGSETVTRFRTQKIAALLAYLALYSHRSHPREELAELFWPDLDPEAARMNLRTALSSLRRLLDTDDSSTDSLITTDGKSYVRLNAAVAWVDAAQFEAAAKRAAFAPPAQAVEQLEEAVAMYGGPLLPGFYDSWALGERDRLAEMYLKATHQLVGLYEATGRIDEALELARKAVSADALREEAHADVIRLLHASGEPAAALRQYQELERLLDRELGMQPSEQVRELAKQGVGVVRVAAPHSALVAPPAQEADTLPPAPAQPQIEIAAARTPTTLPPTLTTFFGREEELAAIRKLLDMPEVRLVTLTGPGGSGKTRLSIEVARQAAESFPGGVWFVPLADLREPERIPDVIAHALGIPASATALPLEQVVGVLTGTPEKSLLVLDNFEQLADEGASAVHALLTRVLTVKCIVSSRQRLPLGAQREFPVTPLPLPRPSSNPDELMDSPSVQLFVSRAQSARPGFELRQENAEAVTAICSRLEGMPLALELAAGWAQTLTPAQMLGRLERRLDLLVSRRRDLPGRHATLRAAIEWSYQLLPPPIQQFFADLSVFRGGWTLEAAEVVSDEPNALEYMARLEEHSLVIAVEEPADASEAGMRFRMLETLREFAAELLAESGDRVQAVSSRHFDYYLGLAQASKPELRGPEQVHRLRRVELEYGNMNAALEWSLNGCRSGEKVLRLSDALGQYWLMVGPWDEACAWIEHGLEIETGTPPQVRCNALATAGQIAWRTQDRKAAKSYCARALALSRELGDNWNAALCLGILGRVQQHAGEYAEARNLLEKAVRLSRTVDDRWLLGHTLCSLGNILMSQGDMERSRACFEEGLAVLRVHGDKHGTADALRGLANALRASEAGVPVEPLIRESIDIFNELGDTITVAYSTLMLGFIAYDRGDHAGARSHYDVALRLARQAGDRYCMAHALHNRAHAYLSEGDLEPARDDFRASLSLFRDLDHAGDIALSLEGFAGLSAAEGRWDRVATLWSASDALRKAMGMPLAAIHHSRRETELAAARSAVGDTRFDEAWDAGQAMDKGSAVAFALEESVVMPVR